MGDAGPLFQTWEFDDDATLQQVVDRSTRGFLAYSGQGIIWHLTGVGIHEIGSRRFAPALSGPGTTDFVQLIFLPEPDRRGLEQRIVELVPGCLSTRLTELPIIEPDGIARLWWWEPHQYRR